MSVAFALDLDFGTTKECLKSQSNPTVWVLHARSGCARLLSSATAFVALRLDLVMKAVCFLHLPNA